MFLIKLTPVHPDGYPKDSPDFQDKNPHAPFFQKARFGGPDSAYATLGEATQAAVACYLETNHPTRGVKGTRYELRAEIVQSTGPWREPAGFDIFNETPPQCIISHAEKVAKNPARASFEIARLLWEIVRLKRVTAHEHPNFEMLREHSRGA